MTGSRLIGWMLTALLVIGGDRALGAGVEHAVSRSQLRFSRLYSGRIKPDVLVLGNSRAVNSIYAPTLSKQLDMTVDSVAYNGVTVDVARALALDALDHGALPKWALVEATTVQGDGAVLNELRLFRRRSPRLEALLEEQYPTTAWQSKVSWLFATNTEMTLRAAYYARQSDLGWVNRYTISPELLTSTASMEPVDFEISTEKNRELRSLVDELEARGIRTCVIIGPYLPSYLDHVSNFSEWKTSLQEALGQRHAVVDYSRLLSDSRYFADRVHSNVNGAEHVGEKLARDMKSGRCYR